MLDTINTNAQSSRGNTKISPFLTKAGTPRTGENHLPGYYCEQQRMWIIDTDNGPQPIINEQALSQLLTKTKAHEEEDDDSYLSLQLVTKTNHQIERDDETWSKNHNSLLQLMTKTDSVQEADDNYSAGHLLELLTKTETVREADDDASHSFEFY